MVTLSTDREPPLLAGSFCGSFRSPLLSPCFVNRKVQVSCFGQQSSGNCTLLLSQGAEAAHEFPARAGLCLGVPEHATDEEINRISPRHPELSQHFGR